MSDERLREIGRAAPLDPDAETRFYTTRLRSAPACGRCEGYGALSQVRGDGSRHSTGEACGACVGTGSPFTARLELAAWCLHRPAQAALPLYTESDHITGICPCAGCVLDNASTGEWSGWVEALSRWADVDQTPGAVLMRGAVAAARVALERDPEQWSAPSVWKKKRRAIEAAEAWLRRPGEECRLALERACNDVGPRRRFASSLMHLPWEHGRDHYFLDVVRDSVEVADEQAVLEAVRRDLIAWALEGMRAS